MDSCPICDSLNIWRKPDSRDFCRDCYWTES